MTLRTFAVAVTVKVEMTDLRISSIYKYIFTKLDLESLLILVQEVHMNHNKLLLDRMLYSYEIKVVHSVCLVNDVKNSRIFILLKND